LYVSGGITDEEGTPSITNPDTEQHLQNRLIDVDFKQQAEDKELEDIDKEQKVEKEELTGLETPDDDLKDVKERPTAYRGKNAPDPNDNFDITGPIDAGDPKASTKNPAGQVPISVIKRIEKELLNDDPDKIDKLRALLETDKANGKERRGKGKKS
jgi:hypothetical protein